MILGSLKSDSVPSLCIGGNSIERVSCFKLLGVIISDDLLWHLHVDSICSKANSRLYFLKLLKRAGLSTDDLKCFYTTVILPVLEYACVVWHHGLTEGQSDQLEALQKRAVRIIYGRVVFGMPYDNALCYSDFVALRERRASLGKSFFDKIQQTTNCLYHLLPPKRDLEVIARLRDPLVYEIPRTRTSRYRSFITHALAKYQD